MTVIVLPEVAIEVTFVPVAEYVGKVVDAGGADMTRPEVAIKNVIAETLKNGALIFFIIFF